MLKRVILPLLTIVFLLQGMATGVKAEADPEAGIKLIEQMQSAFINIAERVESAVVNISPSTTGPPRPSPRQRRGGPKDAPPGSGSGVIIDVEGYIVTNNHVVGDASVVEVRLSDKTKFKGTVVGKDPDTDLALVKIEPADKVLHSVKLGDSSKVKVGQWAIAVGNPFGLDRTVTVGVISALGRENVNLSRYEDFIQTDAAINPGNSGGPLFNIRGEVIGINTAIINFAQGIGFAIPSNMVQAISGQLRERGRVSRGWLGVGIQPLTLELAQKFGVEEGSGVLINEVFEGDPADLGGIQPGDIILSVNDEKVDTPNTLARLVAGYFPGETIRIDVLRDGKKVLINVALVERKDEVVASAPKIRKKFLGLTVVDVSKEIAEKYKLKEGEEGVVITLVDEESVSASEGLREGDLIKEVNRQKVKNTEDFGSIIRATKSTETILMRVSREGRAFFIVLKPSAQE